MVGGYSGHTRRDRPERHDHAGEGGIEPDGVVEFEQVAGFMSPAGAGRELQVRQQLVAQLTEDRVRASVHLEVALLEVGQRDEGLIVDSIEILVLPTVEEQSAYREVERALEGGVQT